MADQNAGIFATHLKTGSTSKKVIIVILAVAYTISPIDLIPDFIPVIGWMDDAGVLIYMVKVLFEKMDTSPALPSPAPTPTEGGWNPWYLAGGIVAFFALMFSMSCLCGGPLLYWVASKH